MERDESELLTLGTDEYSAVADPAQLWGRSQILFSNSFVTKVPIAGSDVLLHLTTPLEAAGKAGKPLAVLIPARACPV